LNYRPNCKLNNRPIIIEYVSKLFKFIRTTSYNVYNITYTKGEQAMHPIANGYYKIGSQQPGIIWIN